ncbi:MAG: hypothetical protein QNL31_00940, partial [Flavobacteriaceae bacterium]
KYSCRLKTFLKGYISGVFVFVCFSSHLAMQSERAVNIYSQYINELNLVRCVGIEPKRVA